MQSTGQFDYDVLLKLVVVGDSGVGKSAIIDRFTGDAFNALHVATIGVDFRVRTITTNSRRVKSYMSTSCKILSG